MKWYEKQKHLYAAKMAAEQTMETVNSDNQEKEDDDKIIDVVDETFEVEESITNIIEETTPYDEEANIAVPEWMNNDQNATYIGKDVVIHGDLESVNHLQFHGVIEGNITCQGYLWLSGAVTGNVECNDAHLDNVIISGDLKSSGQVQLMKESTLCGNATALTMINHGRIKGDVFIENNIKVMHTGAIIGDLTCEELEIERGAVIQGTITMKH